MELPYNYGLYEPMGYLSPLADSQTNSVFRKKRLQNYECTIIGVDINTNAMII